jgi:hypothetical protein
MGSPLVALVYTPGYIKSNNLIQKLSAGGGDTQVHGHGTELIFLYKEIIVITVDRYRPTADCRTHFFRALSSPLL